MTKNDILKLAKKEKRAQLTEIESKELLKGAGIPVVEAKLARTKKEAALLAKDVGFPVALKIVSSKIAHKTEVGGIKLNLHTKLEVQAAFAELGKVLDNVDDRGKLLIQKMAEPGLEAIIGSKRDPHFGQVLMFGLGGIFVEVLRDIVFHLAPVNREEAFEMVDSIKTAAILHGTGCPSGLSARWV